MCNFMQNVKFFFPSFNIFTSALNPFSSLKVRPHYLHKTLHWCLHQYLNQLTHIPTSTPSLPTPKPTYVYTNNICLNTYTVITQSSTLTSTSAITPNFPILSLVGEIVVAASLRMLRGKIVLRMMMILVLASVEDLTKEMVWIIGLYRASVLWTFYDVVSFLTLWGYTLCL